MCRSKPRRKKPACYEAYRYRPGVPGVCLGIVTRKGDLRSRCQTCKWLEKKTIR